MKRRNFLKYSTMAGSAMMLPNIATANYQNQLYKDFVKLTILHTNDVHSRIDPFPMDGSKNEGQGGVAKRAALINKIRSDEKNVLLLDAGDMFQGTPYFNYFNGELEIKMMSKLGYDAATIGNHDFDGGIDNLYNQLKNHANFKIVNCNYDFSNSAMYELNNPYLILNKHPLKIGITGVGVELEGLIPEYLSKGTKYKDPVIQANKQAAFLKNELKCDYVICLSHLGFSYKTEQISDLKLAENSENIDLILGGHTHTFLESPVKVLNLKKEEVLVNQAGWAGIILGRIDVFFERSLKKKFVKSSNLAI